MIPLNIKDEYSPLTDVVMASIENFRISTPINITQAHYYATDPPQLARMRIEQRQFVQTFCDLGVTIHWALTDPDCPLQVFTRDVGTVIDDALLVAGLKREIRQKEPQTLRPILDIAEGRVLYTPPGAIIEGGDVLIEGSTIFVGLGERTNQQGLDFIRNQFPEYEVIPLRLKEGMLHLDVVFNILPRGICIVDPSAFVEVGIDFFHLHFQDVIVVNSTEQFELATNVFSVNPQTILSDEANSHVNSALAERGLTVIALDFEHTRRVGGSLRCATLPLRRT